jgi:S1-C subfamily serine protease
LDNLIEMEVAVGVRSRRSPFRPLFSWSCSNGQPTSFGSGFILRDGLVATNYHVISGATSGYCKVVGSKTTYEIAGTVAVDAPARSFKTVFTGLKGPALPIGSSAGVAVGDAPTPYTVSSAACIMARV